MSRVLILGVIRKDSYYWSFVGYFKVHFKTFVFSFTFYLICKFTTFNADVVFNAIVIQKSGHWWLVDGKCIDYVGTHLILDAAVSDLGSDTRWIANQKIQLQWMLVIVITLGQRVTYNFNWMITLSNIMFQWVRSELRSKRC